MKRIYRHLIHEHNVEKDRRAFDENAAQVRRLLNRDSKTYESLLKSDFAEDTDKVKNATENGGDSAELGSDTKATPPEGMTKSPFSGASASTPFGASRAPSGPFGQSTAPKPLNEPAGLSPNMAPDPSLNTVDAPWWTLFRNITMTQVVLVLSATFILTLMFVTFSIVFNAGGIHFNE